MSPKKPLQEIDFNKQITNQFLQQNLDDSILDEYYQQESSDQNQIKFNLYEEEEPTNYNLQIQQNNQNIQNEPIKLSNRTFIQDSKIKLEKCDKIVSNLKQTPKNIQQTPQKDNNNNDNDDDQNTLTSILQKGKFKSKAMQKLITTFKKQQNEQSNNEETLSEIMQISPFEEKIESLNSENLQNSDKFQQLSYLEYQKLKIEQECSQQSGIFQTRQGSIDVTGSYFGKCELPAGVEDDLSLKSLEFSQISDNEQEGNTQKNVNNFNNYTDQENNCDSQKDFDFYESLDKLNGDIMDSLNSYLSKL